MPKYLKRISLMLFMVAALLTGCSSDDEKASVTYLEDEYAGVTVGELEAEIGTDVVMIIDESGSMVDADKERIAIEGAKLFVDMEKLSNANIGLVEFSDNAKATEMFDVALQENRTALKEILDNAKYHGGAYTDTGAALLESIRLLESSGNHANKSVILFTDGKTEVNERIPGRTLENSLQDVETAVQLVKEKGYVIYCIGLNQNGGVDEAQLAEIAGQTGGEYLIATDVSEITDFFQRIFAQIGDSDVDALDEYVADGTYHTVYFDIDNANILEANIVVLSSKEIEDLILVDAAGNTVDLLNDERIVFSKSSKYTMIKIQNPDVGEWYISVKGVSGDAIKVGRIFNYSLNLVVEVDQVKVSVGIGHWDVRAYFSSEGKKVLDDDFYKTLSGSVFITDVGTGTVEETPLESMLFNSAIGEITMLAAQPKFDHPGVYELTAFVQGSGFYRQSDVVTLYATKNMAVKIKELSKIKLKVGKPYEINLNEYFSDEAGDVITYSVDVGSEKLHTSLNKSTLTLLCEDELNSNIIVYADNGSAQRAYSDVAVVCKDPADTIRNVLIVLCGIGVVTAIVLLIRKSKESVSGVFKVNVESCSVDEYGASNIVTYDIPNIISTNSIGKHGFGLKTLLGMLSGYYMEFDEEKKQSFERCIQRMQSSSGKIYIRGSRKPFEIKVINKNTNVKFVEINNMVSAKKVLVVSFANGIAGGMPILEKKFGIRFLQEGTKDYEQINITYKKM